jgi:hypothetical protein
MKFIQTNSKIFHDDQVFPGRMLLHNALRNPMFQIGSGSRSVASQNFPLVL